MEKEQLNILVRDYQAGDELALDDIFRKIGPMIEETSRELEMYVSEFTKFDCRVILKLKELAKTFKFGKHDFLSAVKAIIGNEKSDFFRRRTNLYDNVSMDELEDLSVEDERAMQFEDPLARVEDEVLYKEKVDLLAQGDERKSIVIENWTKGCNDSEIAELLAQLFGGKMESKRKFVTRFKAECKEKWNADLA